MLFENTSFEGWHVIVGDNGSGKTTLIRSIALSLLDAEVKHSVLYERNKWRRSGSEYSGIRVEFEEIMDNKSTNYLSEIQFESTVTSIFSSQENKNKYFSASYGPYRRFTGGRKEHDKTFESSSQLAAHLSCFGEDVALTEIIPWLQKLQFKKLELTSGLSGERKTFFDFLSLNIFNLEL